ncbi:MAG TPA: NAD(P)/FAD-dependent oxidoreductase [Treponemataceae bacterium]|jgi:prolycopene isomerase|nr:NAD(P)/FAD-dependent oxidoreductase [Treponemataceae bacterium]
MYDTIIIGAGLSGLTAASLLAKRGLNVAVIDKSRHPGGACGSFKRGHVTFDQGSAMLYGFGEKGFNAHRFVMNCLEEPIDIIRHDLLYSVTFNGKRINFYSDIVRFTDELSLVFPSEKENIKRFYRDMLKIYRHVLTEIPLYASADEISPLQGMRIVLRHPLSFARFLTFLNSSAEKLLRGYFSDPDIFKFFDKLTSTYCYATVKEAPAVLAAIMFVDNHEGGSFYPAGGSYFLPGKLEKVIEEKDGDMICGKEVVSILFSKGKPSGVKLNDGSELYAKTIIYSGTVWNLYGKLIDAKFTTDKRRVWAKNQESTYPSVVLFAVVERSIIPKDTSPVEMLVGNPNQIDESEVTAYILSIDDRTLCAEDERTIVVIGPSFKKWKEMDAKEYQAEKRNEGKRLTEVLERRFPGITACIKYIELATPKTIERYTLKNNGAAAGPKQMLGQHITKRLHTRTEWNNFFCCGESTVMGTGTPTVTTSGLTAANRVLRKFGKKPFVYRKNMKNYIRTVPKPFTSTMLYTDYTGEEKEVLKAAMRCRFCEFPSCTASRKTKDTSSDKIPKTGSSAYLDKTAKPDIPGIMRRVSVGNFFGAKKRWKETKPGEEAISAELETILYQYEDKCICKAQNGIPVDIFKVISYLQNLQR